MQPLIINKNLSYFSSYSVQGDGYNTVCQEVLNRLVDILK